MSIHIKRIFYDLLDELQAGDVLVFNNTKVIPARLYGQREGSGGKVEVLLLTPCGENRWECLVKPGKKCPIGQVIVFDERLKATVLDKTDFGGRIVDLPAMVYLMILFKKLVKCRYHHIFMKT